LPYALSLAQENQARLTLLHVVPEKAAAGSMTEGDVASLRAKLNDLIPEETRLWCQPGSFVEKGRPATQLLETANRRGADLIVLGIRSASQHLGSATHLAGATAHKVLVQARCPVLTVRER
jgi:nucleotide-binding universal stress UspA family protein